MSTPRPFGRLVRAGAGLVALAAGLVTAVFLTLALGEHDPFPLVGAAAGAAILYVMVNVAGGHPLTRLRKVVLALGVVIIGAILAWALRPLDDPNRPAREAHLRADLAGLAEAQRRHHREHGRFTHDLSALGYQPAPDVERFVVRADAEVFEISARFVDLGLPSTCVLRVRAPAGAPSVRCEQR